MTSPPPEITVLHVVPDLRRSAGGIAANAPALAEALAAQGIASRFLTRAFDPDAEIAPRCLRVAPTQGPNVAQLARAMAGMRAQVRAGARIVVHSHGLWDPLNHAGLRLAADLGLGRIVSPHGMLLPWARAHKRRKKDLAWHLYQRRDLARAELLHVTSQAEAEAVAHHCPVARIAQVPLGIALPPEGAPTRTRSPNGRKRLLFLGRLHRVKNLDTLIRAFAACAPRDWELRIAGPDEDGLTSALRARAVERDAADRIALAGPIWGAAKQAEIVAADALILPSHTENFGTVVAEALAAARPVIATTGSPWGELAEAGCGWWVAPDLAGLGGAIAALGATTAPERAAMGARGRALVARTYLWPQVGAQMAALYRQAAALRAEAARSGHGATPQDPERLASLIGRAGE
ncbi:glycosyltransferase [Thioclava sp. DLFJ4-1]|uniref:glycosyltransferase n=1 Tax=Thioclava sp. DLFJ4-1 TaxID=1915313 RepID=UPI000997548E|nr:glycosyltransferase [Thioclava sp. DLFJ4-1]OOY17556.1 hypothetical protein BMI85_00905 [Thioclava sp. DLFJ4-1]